MKLKLIIFFTICCGHSNAHSQSIDEKSPEFEIILQKYGQAELYNKSENFTKAAEIYEETASYFVEQFGTKHYYHGLLLNNLATAYGNDNNPQKALPLFKIALENIENSLGVKDPLYGTISGNLAENLRTLQRFKEGIIYAESAIRNTAQNFGKTQIEYALALNTIGSLYFEDNQINKALPNLIEAKEIMERLNSKTHPEYAKILGNLGTCFSELGQLEKAKTYIKQGLDITKTIKGKHNKDYLSKTRKLVSLYMDLYDFDNAEIHITESLEISKKINGEISLEYALSLGQMANFKKRKGDQEKALDYYIKTLNLIEKVVGKKHSEYASALSNLASMYDFLKQHTKALPLRETALKLTEDIYGKDNFSYTTNLNNLVYTLKEMKKYDEALPYLKVLNEKILGEIETGFLLLPEKEKPNFIKNIIGQRLDEFVSFDYQTNHEINEVSTLALNNILLTKGLLLNSNKNVINELEGLKNEDITQKINELRSQKNKLIKQTILPLEKRTIDVKEENNSIQSKEFELIRLYETNFNNINLIQNFSENNLNKDEVAIEFKRFKNYNESYFGFYQYVAYLYFKNPKKLKVVKLFKEKELNQYIKSSASPNELYKTRGAKGTSINTKKVVSDSIFNLVWKPLEPYLKGIETIYYSPDGLLHKIPFAALANSENQLLGESYHLNLMGNTSYIKTKSKTPNLNDSVLIGGIDYTYEPYDTQKVSTEKQHSVLNAPNLLANEDNKKRNTTTGFWSYLKGTQQEVEGIKELLPNSKIISKKNATETAFKKLSGNSPSVIHIATHGYFFKETYCDKDNEEDCERDTYTEADNPLLRSGLIFANANYAWQHGSNPHEEDDGILTVLEISNLDLKNTDIVILSACETGLGDIPNSEGVYGLQRAFKMAGVDLIMMSLWEVPDKETAEFMQLFYTKWKLIGNPKKAFKEAQAVMMKTYRDHPAKWAAFVLFE